MQGLFLFVLSLFISYLIYMEPFQTFSVCTVGDGKKAGAMVSESCVTTSFLSCLFALAPSKKSPS